MGALQRPKDRTPAIPMIDRRMLTPALLGAIAMPLWGSQAENPCDVDLPFENDYAESADYQYLTREPLYHYTGCGPDEMPNASSVEMCIAFAKMQLVDIEGNTIDDITGEMPGITEDIDEFWNNVQEAALAYYNLRIAEGETHSQACLEMNIWIWGIGHPSGEDQTEVIDEMIEEAQMALEDAIAIAEGAFQNCMAGVSNPCGPMQAACGIANASEPTMPGGLPDAPVTPYCPEGLDTDCETGCYTEYNSAVDAANAVWQSGADAAWATYKARLSMAISDYYDCLDEYGQGHCCGVFWGDQSDMKLELSGAVAALTSPLTSSLRVARGKFATCIATCCPEDD